MGRVLWYFIGLSRVCGGAGFITSIGSRNGNVNSNRYLLRVGWTVTTTMTLGILGLMLSSETIIVF